MRKQIERSDWQVRLQTFTSGNNGRTSTIAAEGMTVVENKPLLVSIMIPREKVMK